MNKFASGLLATAVAASFATASLAPANAAPAAAALTKATAPNVRPVSFRGHHHTKRHHGHRYWHGHRGSRHWRRGYRRHGDFWFPLAAFAAGAIISGAIGNDAPPVRVYRRGGAHVNWCYDHYRSYRASDNTYQPYDGPRRQCYSPYS